MKNPQGRTSLTQILAGMAGYLPTRHCGFITQHMTSRDNLMSSTFGHDLISWLYPQKMTTLTHTNMEDLLISSLFQFTIEAERISTPKEDKKFRYSGCAGLNHNLDMKMVSPPSDSHGCNLLNQVVQRNGMGLYHPQMSCVPVTSFLPLDGGMKSLNLVLRGPMPLGSLKKTGNSTMQICE